MLREFKATKRRRPSKHNDRQAHIQTAEIYIDLTIICLHLATRSSDGDVNANPALIFSKDRLRSRHGNSRRAILVSGKRSCSFFLSTINTEKGIVCLNGEYAGSIELD